MLRTCASRASAASPGAGRGASWGRRRGVVHVGAVSGVVRRPTVGARGRWGGRARADDLADEPVRHLFHRRAPRPVDLAQIDDERDVQHRRDRERDGEPAIDSAVTRRRTESGSRGARLRRGRTQQLEQHRRVADGDLAARPSDSGIGAADRRRPGVDAGDGGAVGDARGHVAGEVQEAAAAAFLEQAPAIGDVVPGNDERAARRRPDGDVAGMARAGVPRRCGGRG